MPVDVADAADRIREFLRERRDAADASGYVLGVSGGLDSAVGVTLAADAVGVENVTGLLMPGAPTDPENTRDARALCEDLGVDCAEHRIEPLVEPAVDALPGEPSKTTVGNVRARVRMVLWYEYANDRDLLVLGADNRSEHLLGYYTKYGDGAVDVAALADLYKTEVRDLARHLDLPEKLVEKTPTAELWEGQTDEAEIGVPYEDIDPVLRAYVDDDRSTAGASAAAGVDEATVEHLVELHEASAHKRRRPPTPGIR